jgi:hypothetical protein
MLNIKTLKNEELAAYTLRSLYSRFGYTRYKMSKFEEYDLYVRNKDFLISDGIISNLRRQVKYVLIPAQREPSTVGPRGGVKPGKLLEKECSYIADFVYTVVETGETVVEDTKGFRTKDYLIKRKLMLFVYGIKIKEI